MSVKAKVEITIPKVMNKDDIEVRIDDINTTLAFIEDKIYMSAAYTPKNPEDIDVLYFEIRSAMRDYQTLVEEREQLYLALLEDLEVIDD
jgi:hypothetical protein